jgi:peptidoglycan hydrolase-like protein with peptidoglycan-binding domain
MSYATPKVTREQAVALAAAHYCDLTKPIVIGIRGPNGPNKRGKYDDWICLLTPTVFLAFNGNTDPSRVRKGSGFGANKGMAKLQLGKYHAHGLGKHRGKYTALVQIMGPVKVMRDGTPDYPDEGFFGINIHMGGEVGTSSLGCQTIPPRQWRAFIAAVIAAMREYAITTMPYLLIDWAAEGAIYAPQAGNGGQPASLRGQRLEKGDRGPAVHLLHLLLGMDPNLPPVFGPLTDAKVRKFQKDHGLGDDGVVYTKTWAALPQEPPVPAAPAIAAPVAAAPVVDSLVDALNAVAGFGGDAIADAIRTIQAVTDEPLSGMISPRMFISGFIGTHEGKLSMHPADNGNWYDPALFRKQNQRRNVGILVGSKFGVIASTLVEYRLAKGMPLAQAVIVTPAEMAALDYETAVDVGMELFFKAPGFDKLPWNRVTMSIMDKGWGSGPGTAIDMMQRMIGASVQGGIGPETAAKYTAFLQTHGEEGAARLWADIRKAFDLDLTDDGPNDPDKVFLRGWNNRTESFLPGTTWWRTAGGE